MCAVCIPSLLLLLVVRNQNNAVWHLFVLGYVALGPWIPYGKEGVLFHVFLTCWLSNRKGRGTYCCMLP